MNRRWVTMACVVTGSALAGHAKKVTQVPSVPRSAVEFACPTNQRVKVSLSSWLKWLKDAQSWEEQNRLLARLRLKPVWIERKSDAPPSCNEITQLQDVDVRTEDLSHGPTADTVLTARFNVCTGDGVMALRIQVLRPLSEDEWCALGDDLSLNRTARELGCVEDVSKVPRALSFVNVTRAERKTLEVRDQSGNCEPPRHEPRSEISYWDVEGASLKRIFSAVTYESRPSDLGQGERVTTRHVAPAGEYPKTIAVIETIQETNPDAPTTLAKKKSFVWKQGRYTEE